MEVSGQLNALAQRKSPWCPFDRRLGVPQNWYGHGGEGKNSQALLGLEPPNIQPVVQWFYSFRS
jgi:hypothetical protein